LRQAQSEIGERIDKLATDLLTQLGKVQKDLSQQITRLNEEQTQRLNTARAEGQKRDEDLRQEMLKLTAALDDKSTARHDLGQMYMELGRRLYNG
jgi:flagellin-like hook-associated protein FlgL